MQLLNRAFTVTIKVIVSIISDRSSVVFRWQRTILQSMVPKKTVPFSRDTVRNV